MFWSVNTSASMAARNSGVFVASKCLKSGIMLSFVGFILHIVGFSTARWAAVTMTYSTKTYFRITYHVGLWEHCTCLENGFEHCACFKFPNKEPDWLNTVLGMVILGFIGWFITGINCLVLVCYRQSNTLKKFNIFSTVCSGISIAVGLIIFGIRIQGDYSGLSSTFINLDTVESSGRLNYSFIMCAVAAGIALIPCLCLFVIDLRSEITTPTPTDGQQHMVTWPIQISNQGQILYVPWNHVQVIANGADQQVMARHVPECGHTTMPPPYTPSQDSGGYNMSNIPQHVDNAKRTTA